MNDNKEEKGFIKGKYYLEINHELNIETKLDYEKEIEKKINDGILIFENENDIQTEFSDIQYENFNKKESIKEKGEDIY